MDSFFNIAMVLSFLISLFALLRLHQAVKVGNARIAILSNLVKRGRSAEIEEGEGPADEQPAAVPSDPDAPFAAPIQTAGTEEEFRLIWAQLNRLNTLADELESMRAQNAQLEDRVQTQIEAEAELMLALAYKEDELRSSQSDMEARPAIDDHNDDDAKALGITDDELDFDR